MNGKRLWAKNLSVPDIHYGHTASLLIHGNLLLIQYDHSKSAKIMALDVTTGAERWSKSRPDKENWTSPIIANINNTPQLVLMGCPSITSYNPNTGEQLWRVEFLMGEVATSACSAGGMVYAASEYAKLLAIDATDGTVLWDNNDFLPEVSSPVATKDNVYIATSYGFVVSFDAQTGKTRVEHELGTGFYSSPIIADGKVFLINTDGKVHIFSADNEFRLLDSFETGESTLATPAFTDGKIVVRTDKSIYCVAIK
jgi:outer membrane protein assembly factor BamB